MTDKERRFQDAIKEAIECLEGGLICTAESVLRQVLEGEERLGFCGGCANP